MRPFLIPSTAAVALALLGPGCGLGDPVTPGAQDDMASMRLLIESGRVPHPDSIDVEEFLSDHVIFADDEPDGSGVFFNVDTAWHHDFSALTPQATMQIGFGTDLNTESFERGNLNLGLVVDRSRSMGGLIDSTTGTTKFDAVKFAVDRMLAQLTEADLVSIVVFNDSSETLLEAAKGNNISAIKGALDPVTTQGGKDLADGLRLGFQALARRSSSERMDRVLLFTDAQLHGGNGAQLDEVMGVMRSNSAANLDTTVFSVGSEPGEDVALEIAQIRGANSSGLRDFDQIVEVFDHEFDFLVTPVAYDVTLTVDVPFEFDVVDVYGVPADRPYGRELVSNTPTLFISPRQKVSVALIRTRAGSLVNFNETNRFGTVTLTYKSMQGSLVSQDPIAAMLPAGIQPDANSDYFENDRIRRGVLLLNTVLTIKRACEDVYNTGSTFSFDDESRTVAIARIDEFLGYFDELAAGLDDRLSPDSRSLSEERALLVQLRSNLGN